MTKSFVFIYSKEKKIKALSLSDSQSDHDRLIAEGWKHTQTLDACKWIEHIYNDCNNAEKTREIENLSI